jgi:hypothetical protein
MLYFVLTDTFDTILTSDVPTASCWKHEISFRSSELSKVTLVNSGNAHVPYTVPRASCFFTPAVLKSNLQKAVRRGFCEIAKYTAWQLLQQGETTELLRRLPIILLEDTLLHPRILPRWIWWMLANSRGYSFSQTEIQQLLADVGHIANPTCTPYRDLRMKEESDVCLGIVGIDGNATERELSLFSIWVRSQWGGMTGDMAWLRGFLLQWSERSKEDWCRIPRETPVLADLPNTNAFQEGVHTMPEAVDFHCCTRMLPELAAKCSVTEKEIKEAIWWHRSEPNCRTWFSEHGQKEKEKHETCRQNSREIFATIEHLLESYVKSCWKCQKSQSRQVSFLHYLFPSH